MTDLPAPPAWPLQQKHIVRIEVRPDAPAGRCVADHQIVDPREAEKAESIDERPALWEKMIHVVHQQGPATCRQTAQEGARKRAMLYVPLLVLPNDYPRADIVAAGGGKQLRQGEQTAKAGPCTANEERL